MDAQDRERFLANRTWFNEFFAGLKQVFDKMAKALRNELGLAAPKFYYYPQPKSQPVVPRYYVMGLGGKRFAVQVFAVLDPALLENPAFTAEPSLVVVKHGRGDRSLYLEDFGLRVLRNDRLGGVESHEGWVSGVILGHDTPFQAFQVGLDQFAAGQDVEAAIQRAVVDVMRRLPELPAAS